ncbi:MAG: hypothetical protein AAGA08_00825 [Pseudomonadota bacterium]
MTQPSIQSLEAEIMNVLEEEQLLLLKADFESLSALSQRKEALVDALKSRGAEENPRQTDAIKSKAERNAQLYVAALSGLGQAIDRISEIRSTLGKIKTYDDRGQVTTTNTQAPSISIKA